MRTTMGAMVRYKRLSGRDVSEITTDLTELMMFMYCCVQSASAVDKVDFDMSFEDFADRIDLSDFNSFQGSLQGDEPKKKMSAQ